MHVSNSSVIEQLRQFIESDDWKPSFSETALTTGYKIARAKQVLNARAEILDTGDIEVVTTVMDKEGHQEECTIAFWEEDGSIQLDTSCTCAIKTSCHHAAAVIEHLSRPNRLELAFGEIHDNTPQPSDTLSLEPNDSPAAISFQLHIKKNSNTKDFPWLPEIYATAVALYGNKEYPLDPAGNIAPPRDRAAEMNALNTLYALDLLPGAEQPPHSLKKLTPPSELSTLWAPDSKQWQPSLYWQRFRHEGIASLEKRNWKVTLAPDVGHKPLTFNASSWRAEIVEEGHGWFHLSAGFEVDGEEMQLEPILALSLIHI